MYYSKKLKNDFRRIYSFLRMVNYYTSKLLKYIDINIKDKNSLYYGIILYHLNKCFTLSNASYILINHGHLNEVDILLRTFWETYININYISKDVNQRILLFQLDELNEHLESKINIIPYYDNNKKTEIRKKINEIIQDRNAIIKDLEKYKNDIDYEKFKWSNIHIEEKSKKLKLKKEYIFLYSSWSETVHPSSKGVTKYLKYENKKVLPLLIKDLDDGMIPHRILFLCEYLIDFIFFTKKQTKIDKIGTLYLSDDLKKLADFFNKLNPILD